MSKGNFSLTRVLLSNCSLKHEVRDIALAFKKLETEIIFKPSSDNTRSKTLLVHKMIVLESEVLRT